jgi:hypothetical protein
MPALKALGHRFQLAHGIIAEVFDSGAIALNKGNTQEKFDSDGYLQSTTDRHTSLFATLGVPVHLHTFIAAHGRPIGTIWEETENAR